MMATPKQTRTMYGLSDIVICSSLLPDLGMIEDHILSCFCTPDSNHLRNFVRRISTVRSHHSGNASR